MTRIVIDLRTRPCEIIQRLQVRLGVASSNHVMTEHLQARCVEAALRLTEWVSGVVGLKLAKSS